MTTSLPPDQHEAVDFVERRQTYRRKEDKHLAALIDMHIGMSAKSHKNHYAFIKRLMAREEKRQIFIRTVTTQVAIWAVISVLLGVVFIFSTGAHLLVKGWALSSKGGTTWSTKP